jgi:hypothetical protein
LELCRYKKAVLSRTPSVISYSVAIITIYQKYGKKTSFLFINRGNGVERIVIKMVVKDFQQKLLAALLRPNDWYPFTLFTGS